MRLFRFCCKDCQIFSLSLLQIGLKHLESLSTRNLGELLGKTGCIIDRLFRTQGKKMKIVDVKILKKFARVFHRLRNKPI